MTVIIKRRTKYIFVVLVSAIIIAGICWYYHVPAPIDYIKKSQQKYDSLLCFAPYLGKRVAFWGIVVSGEKRREDPYVLAWGNSKLRIKLYFLYNWESLDYFFKKANLSYSYSHTRETRRVAYISGVITYDFLNLKIRSRLKRDIENGTEEMLYPPAYGEFCLSDPEAIKILPKEKEKDFVNTVPYKIEVQELTDEDKQFIKSPFLEDAGKNSFQRYLQYLKDGK